MGVKVDLDEKTWAKVQAAIQGALSRLPLAIIANCLAAFVLVAYSCVATRNQPSAYSEYYGDLVLRMMGVIVLFLAGSLLICLVIVPLVTSRKGKP